MGWLRGPSMGYIIYHEVKPSSGDTVTHLAHPHWMIPAPGHWEGGSSR